MGDVVPVLRPWCRKVERVYRTESVPPKPRLIADTVHLVDQLQSIVSTGAGVAEMKDTARTSTKGAFLVLGALRSGSLCRSGSGTVGSSTALVVVPSN
jgi:hypothetical protein